MDELPFIPNEYKFKLIDDTGVKKQFETIKKLININNVDIIVNCGDADREGEVIIRITIESFLENKKDMLPEQTNETIRNELKNIRNNNEYELLYDEGFVKTCVDWIHGINLTRLLTCKV
ncbi:hypothetical protein [Romboutsia sp. MSSM.1001216sp_RTP31141st1_G3_RTP31141_220114]|uniref:hypothetical protein n=1 Tax=unclassified Romboutsia TaxID=2626894 RepID=UPI0031B5EAC4